MKGMSRWIWRSVFVALVATVMVFAGPKFVAAQGCPPPVGGTCPPLSNTQAPFCSEACILLDWPDGGLCMGTCCTCFM